MGNRCLVRLEHLLAVVLEEVRLLRVEWTCVVVWVNRPLVEYFPVQVFGEQQPAFVAETDPPAIE